MRTRSFSAAFLALAALCISSCVTTPEPNYEKLGLSLPSKWSEHAASKPKADSKWVARFNDPKLTKLVAQALENNKNLQETAARIKQAHARAAIAGADRRPQLDVRHGGLRNQRSFIGFPRGTAGQPGAVETAQSTLSNTFNLDLNLTWEIDLWGRIANAKKAALADLDASEADYQAAQLSIAAQTAKTWFLLTANQEQVDLSKRALTIFKQTSEIIRGEFEEGLGQNAAAELQLALADVENAGANVQQRQEQVMRTQRLLEVVLGEYPDGSLKTGSKLPGAPSVPGAGVPAQLLDRRPDLRAAERRLAASDKRVVEAKRSLLPTLSLTGSYGTSTENISELFNSDFTVWSAAYRAAQPILDGQRLRQNVKLRQAEGEAALANYQQTALEAFQEVEEALAAEKYLASRVEFLQKSVVLSKDALDRAKDDYVGGVGDVLTILRAQQQLINSESALIDARRQRLDNRVDLHVALGGDFKRHEASSGASKDVKPDN